MRSVLQRGSLLNRSHEATAFSKPALQTPVARRRRNTFRRYRLAGVATADAGTTVP